MDALREKRFTLLQEIEGVAETIEREHPEIVGADDTPLTLDQIQRTLDDRTRSSSILSALNLSMLRRQKRRF